MARRILFTIAVAGCVLVLLAGAWAMGWSGRAWTELARHRGDVGHFIAAHREAAVALYFLLFLAVTVLAVPGVSWVIVAAGRLLGLGPALAATIAAGWIGGIVLFLAARGVFRRPLTRRASGFLSKIDAAYAQDEALYLLALRVSPIVPYCIANIAPALLDTRLKTFAWTAALGLVPSVFVYAWIGAALGGAFAGPALHWQTFAVHAGAPLIALSALPLLGVGVRRALRARQAARTLAGESHVG